MLLYVSTFDKRVYRLINVASRRRCSADWRLAAVEAAEAGWWRKARAALVAVVGENSVCIANAFRHHTARR